MSNAKPAVSAELIWSEELQFGATSGSTAIIVDGNSAAGPSPVQLLAIALAGCSNNESARQELARLNVNYTASDFIEHAREMLDGVLVFWRGLDSERTALAAEADAEAREEAPQRAEERIDAKTG